MEEVLEGNTTNQYLKPVLENFLKVREQINSRLENAASEQRKLIRKERVNYDFEQHHFEQNIFEELLRHGYSWQEKQKDSGKQNKYSEYRIQAEKQRTRRLNPQHGDKNDFIITAKHRKYAEILGVKVDATLKEIKQVYRKLAVKYHPDKNPSNKEFSAAKFIEVTDAYLELLKIYKQLQQDE